MGLFNFIYKLTNILSNKKKLKVFIIIAIVIVIVFAWSRGCFAAEPTPEQSQALTNYQLQLQYACFTYLSNMYKQGMLNSNVNSLANLARCQVYVNTSISDKVKFVLHLYNINYSTDGNSFTIDGSWSMGVLNDGTISGTEFPCKLAQFNGQTIGIYGTVNTSQQPIVSTATPESFYLPSPCYNVRSTAINEFLELIGVFPQVPTTYNTNDDELQALTQAGFQNQVNAINNATSAINDVNSSVEDVNQSVMDMINTIVDPYVNVSQEQLPQSNVQDSTEDGLDNIFTIIKNAFTGTPQSVSFPVPFTDKSFTIEPGFTENSMKKGGLNAMVSVIHLYWYYRIYSFIFLKYVELLEKLKEGEFEETVGNIKKEVL